MRSRFEPTCRPPMRWHDRRWPPYARKARVFRWFALFACALMVLTGYSVVLARGVAALVILGVIGAAALTVMVSRFAPRVGAVMDAADRVAGGDYEVRVDERGPRSMRALARSFNTMTERLQNNDRLRRDLMADVAHELRTPLTIIHGKLEGLVDGVYPRDEGQLRQLLEQTRILSRLVEDLRTLALSESGALKLQREPTDVAALARDVAKAFDANAVARGVRLAVQAADAYVVDVDPVRVREVIGNLVSNALQHTPAGGAVTVSVARAERAATDGVVIEVRDTGSGMTPDQLAHAFDRFYKSDRSRGSGLGLTIAKGLVAAHGGAIRASSELGRGTTIVVTLPPVLSSRG